MKNIVFDMGNVLIRFIPETYVANLDVAPEDRELLLKEIFRSEDWLRLDNGSLKEEEFMELLKDRLPKQLHEAARRMVFEWDQPLYIISGMEEMIHDLKQKGYRIFLLSNASARQHEYWERIPASRYFDGTLISADVHMVKPNPEIYRELFRTFDLEPEECVFIDDSSANIEAGRKLGMDGFIFTGDVEALRRWIDSK